MPKGWHQVTYEAQAVAARSYTLATLHPRADFDLYPDQRSQMYGGIRAERPETNFAVGATGQFSGRLVRRRFGLGSTDFEVSAMTLDDPPARSLYGSHVEVHGWVRGLGRAGLQELTDQGWLTVRRIHANDAGLFSVSVPALRSTQLRLAYNDLAGGAVALRVAPRVSLQASGAKLRVLVAPRLPLQVQRLSRSEWRPVARSTGAFDGTLRPGSYRVAVLGGPAYVPAVSRPIEVRA